eukprot:1145430-Pelagomonas_calceolata.AAC.7
MAVVFGAQKHSRDILVSLITPHMALWFHARLPWGAHWCPTGLMCLAEALWKTTIPPFTHSLTLYAGFMHAPSTSPGSPLCLSIPWMSYNSCALHTKTRGRSS